MASETSRGRAELFIENQIAIVRFSSPPEGFMDEGTVSDLAAAMDRIDSDESVRACVLTGGQDDVFIRHFDVRVLEARSRALKARGKQFSLDRPVPEPQLHALMRRMEESRLPFIAAINGTAMGGGFELCLACDIRFAQSGTYPIGLPEVNLGILPGAGGTQRLSRLIGPARALELMLCGATVTPQQAAALGIVNRCVDAPVLTEAMALARTIADKPARAVGHIKQLVRMSGLDEAAMAAERTLFCDLMVTDEAIELMARMNAGSNDIRNP